MDYIDISQSWAGDKQYRDGPRMTTMTRESEHSAAGPAGRFFGGVRNNASLGFCLPHGPLLEIHYSITRAPPFRPRRERRARTRGIISQGIASPSFVASRPQLHAPLRP